MKIPRTYIIILSLGIIILILLEYHKPDKVSWDPNFSSEEKTPYGTYVLYNSLSDLFKDRTIHENSKSLFEFIRNNGRESFNVISVANQFNPDTKSLEKLMNHVAEGNTVFISTLHFSPALIDSLNIDIRREYFKEKKWQQLDLKKWESGTNTYEIEYSYELTFDSVLQNKNAKILGYSRLKHPNFVQVKYKKGAFYLHSSPLAFSNYHILKRDTKGYVEQVFSRLPGNPVVWHDRTMQDTYVSSSPLRYILSVDTLQTAYYLVLLTALLYLIFNIKRRQQVIPVVESPPERSFLFIRSVAKLYYFEKDHKAIALKKIRHFRAFLKERFFLREVDFTDDFAEVLSRKTKYDSAKLKQLFALIHRILSDKKISGELLIELNRQLEAFIEHTENE